MKNQIELEKQSTLQSKEDEAKPMPEITSALASILENKDKDRTR